MNEEATAIALLVISALDELQIKYLIGGSLASSSYGEPRSTRDIDIIADIRPEHVSRLCELLEPEFNVMSEAMRNAIERRSSFNAIHFDSVIKIDIFVPKDRPFEKQEFERRLLRRISCDKQAYFASPEDIVLAKLEWYRLGNDVSDQQWRDIVGIFKACEGRLDVPYMSQTAEQLGVLDLLQRLVN